MDCSATQTLIDGYLDGELDLVRNLDIEQHMHGCPGCTQALQQKQVLRERLQALPLRFKAPAGLQDRIRTSVRRTAAPTRRPRPGAQFWLGIAAGLLLAVSVLTWGFLYTLPRRAANDLLAQEVVSSYVRAQLLDGHQLDVISSNQHVVKPWFNGKIDFAPVVKDLAMDDFPLKGGRLDYVGSRPVAVLIYTHRQHVINVFIWPSTEGETAPPATTSRQGYHLVRWTQAGLTYWAISDLNEHDLEQFATLIQAGS